MKRNWLDYITVLIALASQAAVHSTNAACAVRLELDELNSTLVLSSTNTLKRSSSAPLAASPTFNKTVPRGLSGVLYAVSQTLSSCPAASDRAAWLANWPSFTLTSVPISTTQSQAISVYPALHLAKNLLSGNYTYNYNLSDLQLAVTIRSMAASTGQSGAFTADVATQLVDGWLSSFSTLTGLRVDNLKNLTANASSVSASVDVLAVNGSSTLVLEIPSVQLTYMSIGQVTLGNSAWDSFANNTLTSRLKATAVLNCPGYCGDYGRCQVINGTALCVCECGWSKDDNGQCNMPWGFCDANSGNVVVVVQEVAAPATPSTPSAPSAPSAVQPNNGTCPSGYDWDASGTSCAACPSGFTGHDCSMCVTSAACQSKLSSSTAQCGLSPLYQPTTTVKNYECDVLDPSVAGIVGTSLDFTCSTLPPATGASVDGLSVGAGLVSRSSPVNSTPFCTLSFRLAGMPRDAAVVCSGWACEFTTSSSRVHCPLVQCRCPKGCASADGAITEATFTNLNTDIQLACGGEAGKAATTSDGVSSCSIELSGLPLAPIPLSCTTAECLDPVNGTVNVRKESTETKTSPVVAPIIAFVPSMALLLAALLTAAAVVYFDHLVGPRLLGRGGATGASAAAAAVIPVPAATPAQPVVESTEADGPRSGSIRGGGDRPPEPRDEWAVHPLPSGNEEAAEQAPPPPPPEWPSSQGGQQQPQSQPRLRPSLPGQLATPSPQGTPQQGNSASERAPSGSCSADRQGSSSRDGSGAVVAGKDDVAAVVAAAAPAKVVAEGSCPAALADVKPGSQHWGAITDGGGQHGVRVLSWHGLDLTTRTRRSALPPWRLQPPATLLCNVSGAAFRGQLLGILGPSGSGKTTLLGVLAGLIQPGMHWRLDGCVRVDGRRVESPQHLAALVGHVPQHDSLCRSLTVAECVAASAALRLSWRELQRGRQHVQARVASVLQQLGISYLANRVVWPGGGSTLTAGGGDAATTLSGGERLRVAAALELVYNPPVLLLDEPLSGLDSATAKAMMALIRSVATGGDGCDGGGRVVVASLHQPSPALFAHLDSVLLMSAGRVAAAGPPAGLAAGLAAAGLPRPPPDVHIAEHLLDIVVSQPDQATQLCDWHEGNGVEPMVAYATTITTTSGGGGGGGGRVDRAYIRVLVAERGGGTGVWVRLRRLCLEVGVVAWRSGLDMLRNPALLALHLLVTGALGLLVGAVFSDTNLNVSGAQNRVGAIFFSVMLLACFATSAVDGLYPERATVDRDLLRRSYGIVPYMLAKLVLDGVLLRALPACAFALPFYWLMGLRHQAAAFFTFLGAFVTMSCLSGAACIALSSIFSSPGRAVLVLNLLLLTCALFSGFLANKASIVVWLRWIVYLSPIRFCWEALVINELKPLVLTFSSPDLPQGLPAVKGSLFLSLLGVNANMLDTDLIVLGCMYAILALLALVFAALRLAAIRGRWT